MNSEDDYMIVIVNEKNVNKSAVDEEDIENQRKLFNLTQEIK